MNWWLIILSINKDELRKLIETIPEQDAAEVLDFIGYLKMKRDRDSFHELEQASITSTEFWNNLVDDEVWNDV
jgi:hypothetical protein